MAQVVFLRKAENIFVVFKVLHIKFHSNFRELNILTLVLGNMSRNTTCYFMDQPLFKKCENSL